MASNIAVAKSAFLMAIVSLVSSRPPLDVPAPAIPLVMAGTTEVDVTLDMADFGCNGQPMDFRISSYSETTKRNVQMIIS